MNQTQQIQSNVECVHVPEEIVGPLSNGRMGEHKDDAHYDEEQNSRRASHSLEEPEGDVRLVVGGEVHFPRQTAQILVRLRGHVVEVDNVSDRVQHREEQRRAGGDLVELNVRVQGNVLLYGELLQLRDEVSAIKTKDLNVRNSFNYS